MLFSKITIFAVFFAISVSAAPVATEDSSAIEKRTCGSLKGTALQICQDACEVACGAISLGLSQTLCKDACTLGSL